VSVQTDGALYILIYNERFVKPFFMFFRKNIFVYFSYP